MDEIDGAQNSNGDSKSAVDVILKIVKDAKKYYALKAKQQKKIMIQLQEGKVKRLYIDRLYVFVIISIHGLYVHYVKYVKYINLNQLQHVLFVSDYWISVVLNIYIQI